MKSPTTIAFVESGPTPGFNRLGYMQLPEDNDIQAPMKKLRSYRVTIIAPTCFYYQAPLFRALAADSRINLMVYFCSDEGYSGKDVSTLYGVDTTWEMGDEMLLGYKWKFLRNHAPWGSYLKSVVGLINLGVWKELGRDRPDLVVVMSWMNPTWWLTFIASLRFGIPLAFMTDANFDAEQLKGAWKSWVKGLFLGKFLFKITRGFLYAGTANRNLYTHYGVPDSKLISFAYSWGYESLIKESAQLKAKKSELRKRYGVPEDAVVILYAGRLSPEKGTLDLLDAYSKVSHPRKALVIVGDGQLRKQMEDSARSQGIESVYHMGFQARKDMGKFFALADIFVLPSHRETWGIVVNEALCFSLPVIVSDQVGAGVDLVVPEENGYIYPARDVSALANRISQLMEVPDEDLIKMGERSAGLISEWSARDLAKPLGEFLDQIYDFQR